MQGTMQDRPLTLTHFFDRAERYFPRTEVVTGTATGVERTTYGEWAQRTRRLGGVLDELGGEREVVVLQERHARRHVGRALELEEVADDLLGGLVERVGLAGDDQLNRPVGAAEHRRSAFGVAEDEVSAFVGRESTREPEGQDVFAPPIEDV